MPKRSETSLPSFAKPAFVWAKEKGFPHGWPRDRKPWAWLFPFETSIATRGSSVDSISLPPFLAFASGAFLGLRIFPRDTRGRRGGRHIWVKRDTPRGQRILFYGLEGPKAHALAPAGAMPGNAARAVP